MRMNFDGTADRISTASAPKPFPVFQQFAFFYRSDCFIYFKYGLQRSRVSGATLRTIWLIWTHHHFSFPPKNKMSGFKRLIIKKANKNNGQYCASFASVETMLNLHKIDNKLNEVNTFYYSNPNKLNLTLKRRIWCVWLYCFIWKQNKTICKPLFWASCFRRFQFSAKDALSCPKVKFTRKQNFIKYCLSEIGQLFPLLS